MSKVFYTRVYKRDRKSHGRIVRSYRGYYTLEKSGRRVWKELGTPDRAMAERRIMAFALEAQREQEGLVAPRAMRDTASKTLSELVDEYERDLTSRKLARRHVHDTIRRIQRMVIETKWRYLTDIRPDLFVAWRSMLQVSAKTNKEYQVSLNAFLNWLVRTDRLAANPLARVGAVETRGREVRRYRAFTEEEMTKLFAVAGKRQQAYQVLLYTGQRKSEVKALVWGDLHLDAPQPYALFREGTMKDKEKRSIPLRHELAEMLRQMKPADVEPTSRVFWLRWPSYENLRNDLKNAGIDWKDGLGRVVHFHSFRKTWQTLGVRYGVNQRSAQVILGHSDANLTAHAYTDVPSLELPAEMAKLPWLAAAEIGAQPGAQKSVVSCASLSPYDFLAQLIESVKVIGPDKVSHALASAVTSSQTSERMDPTGLEPVTSSMSRKRSNQLS